MEIRKILLLRVSSHVDKDVEHPQFFDPSYPLKYLQAGLELLSELQVMVMDCWIRPLDVPDMLAVIVDKNPDLVVLSASSFEIDEANALAAALKQRATPPLVVGIGQGFYLLRDFRPGAESAYDAILLGEVEEEFFRLFERIRTEAAAGWRQHYRSRFEEGHRFVVEDPDRLPFPSYTPVELAAYKSIYPVQVPKKVVWGFLIATRGCPHGCVFCSEVMRVSIGTKLRSRSPANVADEMEHMARQGINIVSFQDDSFSANKPFVRALCQELIARGSRMPWMARVRVDELTRETLELMQRAGCVMLGIGVESGSERIIEAMHKQHRPGPWLEMCRQVFRWTRQLGIGTNAYYVIGNPTETREEIEQTIRFACELNSDTIQVHFYTVYPGSKAAQKYREKHEEYDPTSLFHYATPEFSLAEVSAEELVELRSKFYRTYMFRPSFALRHMARYWSFYLHNLDVFLSLLGIRKVF